MKAVGYRLEMLSGPIERAVDRRQRLGDSRSFRAPFESGSNTRNFVRNVIAHLLTAHAGDGIRIFLPISLSIRFAKIVLIRV